MRLECRVLHAMGVLAGEDEHAARAIGEAF
jgi:hypothetical protein